MGLFHSEIVGVLRLTLTQKDKVFEYFGEICICCLFSLKSCKILTLNLILKI